MAAGAGKVSWGGGSGEGGWTRRGVRTLNPRSSSAERSAEVWASRGDWWGAGWRGCGLRRAGTGAWRPFVLMFSPPGRKVSCLVGHSLSVSHRPRVVEAAADPARGLQASPPISGPASLPHLLVRWELWLLSLRWDPRGGDPERRRPVCWAAARSPGVQGPTSCGPRPLSLPGVAPRSVRTGLPSRISALGAGTPARCPGVLTRPLPAPLPVRAPRAKDPSHRRLGSCQGPRATSRAASAQQEQCRLSRWRSRPPCRPPRLCPSTLEAFEEGRWLPRGARLHLPSARKDLPGRTEPTLPSCCSAATFPPPRGKSGRDPKQNTRIGVWLICLDTSSPQTVFQEFSWPKLSDVWAFSSQGRRWTESCQLGTLCD